MTADEVYLWLLPVMAFGAFLLGGYLLVSGRQAKAAGQESNKIKFLGVEIESSTSGTTLIILAIVVIVVVISLGIGRAVDDGNDDNGGDDPTTPTTSPDEGPDTGPDPDPPPASGLTRDDNVIPTSELNNLTTGLGVTWTPATAEERPALNCLQGYLVDEPGRLRPLAFEKWRGVAPYTFADAAATVVKFETEEQAEDTYDRVVGWLERCGEEPPLVGGRELDVARAGTDHEVDSSIYWRNYQYEGLADCIPCMMTDSQAVGRADDIVVVFSIAWVDQSGAFIADGGPIEDVMRQSLELADD